MRALRSDPELMARREAAAAAATRGGRRATLPPLSARERMDYRKMRRHGVDRGAALAALGFGESGHG